MDSGTKIALAIFTGLLAVAAAIWLALRQVGLSKQLTLTPTPTFVPSPQVTPTSAVSPSPEASPTQEPTSAPSPTPTPEITWTKEDIVKALSEKTGIPEDKITFSIGQKINQGDKILIRGGVGEKMCPEEQPFLG